VRQHGCLELGDGSRPLAEPLRVDTTLDATLKQHLHTDTDAEHRSPTSEALFDHRATAHSSESVDNGSKSSDTGNQQPIGSGNTITVSGQFDARTGSLQRFRRRVHVARAVIENDNGWRTHDYSAPFVDGIPFTFSSNATA
jgi:hypothetical protein